jgi:anti-sigma regulatory factor (Ser/Thr protein kinase)
MPPSSSGSKAKIVIGNNLAEMAKIADLVEQFGAAHAVPQKAIIDLNICLDEIVSNTITYGYSDAARHEIAVELSLEDNLLRAEIKDDAAPFDPREAEAPPAPDPKSPKIGGLGLHFVKSLINEINYRRDGNHNVTTLTKKLQ